MNLSLLTLALLLTLSSCTPASNHRCSISGGAIWGCPA